jgi:signal transduction histidine kinase
MNRGLKSLLRLLLSPVMLGINAVLGLMLWLYFQQLSVLSEDLIFREAVNQAQHLTSMMQAFRSLYSSEVVPKIETTDIPITHDYLRYNQAIPLPATLTKLLGEEFLRKNPEFQFQLRSAYPFPYRDNLPLDDFEQQALAHFQVSPQSPFYRVEQGDKGPQLRYATADIMRSSCVNCHNTHEDSPKTDWKTGDVRGVLSLSQPLNIGATLDRKNFQSLWSFIFFGAVIWLMGLVYLLARLNQHAKRLQLTQLALDEANLLKRRDDLSLRQKQQELSVAMEHIQQRNEELEAIRAELESANTDLVEQFSRQDESRAASINLLQDMSLAKTSAEQANQFKSEFLAHMSHEVRTPMNGILGVLQLFRRSPLTQQQKSWLTTLEDASGNMVVLLNDILDFSKVESGQISLNYSSFALFSLISSVYSLMLARAQVLGVELVLDCTLPKSLLIHSDASRLQQVLTNLLSNALKFTPSGQVILRVRHQILANQKIQLTFEVKDTGIGVSDDDKKIIFQPFTQANVSSHRDVGGTGLGLSICRRLVELWHGDLGVKDNPGGGAIFWFSLEVPLGCSDKVLEKKGLDLVLSGTPAKAVVSASRGVASCRILVAEDNPINQLVMTEILSQLHLEYTLVENGLEAVEKSALERYGLILMDCKMPKMDGFEAAQLIRNKGLNKKTPIIAVTANVMELDKGRCLAVGMDDYLAKPMLLAEVEEKIKYYLRR